MIDVRRREFITLLGGAAAAWPHAARAQQPAKLPTIGFLGASTASAWSHWSAAFAQRLRELGWMEGRTVAIEYRWAEGRGERYAEIAAEFVRLKVDVIVTAGGAVPALKRETSVIPIVFAIAVDPVGSGLVASLARPGGNVTGLSMQATDLAGKRLEILREVLPGLHQLAIMANVGYPGSVVEIGEVQAAARKLALEVDVLEIRRVEDIAPAFGALKSGTQALYVCGDALVTANRARISTLALGARLPTIYPDRAFLETGGLMAYGANNADLFRRAADYVDKILRGAKPADLPVEQPTKFDLVVNLITAKALGLEVPPTLLARADEVIE
jgi:putative ABC transport system substrate-binding protein